jgi:hypothetical protein
VSQIDTRIHMHARPFDPDVIRATCRRTGDVVVSIIIIVMGSICISTLSCVDTASLFELMADNAISLFQHVRVRMYRKGQITITPSIDR